MQTTTLKPSQVGDLVMSMFKSSRNLWIWGPPGCGKTGLMEYLAAKAGIPLIIHPPAVTMESVDVRGLPTIDAVNGQTRWAPCGFWPTDPNWEGIVYLDEFSQGSQSTQAAYMQAIQSKRIGDLVISPGARFVVTGNRATDRAGVGRILTPLLNRFTHVDMVPDLVDWQGWAVEAGVHQHVRSFLNFKPSLLMTFDAAVQQRAFASPRSWQFVSDLYPHTPADLLFPAVAGTVGDGPASEFLAFVQVFGQLPDPEECLKNPMTAPVPDADRASGPATFCALSGALAEKLRGGKRTTAEVDNFGKYLLRFSRMEYQALAVRDGAALDSRVVYTPSLSQWLTTNSHILARRGAAKR